MGNLKGFTKLFLLLQFVVSFNFIGFSQLFNQKVANQLTQVEYPLSFLQKYEQLGVKDVNHNGLDSTYYWLKELIENEGFKAIEHKYTYDDGFEVYNLRNLEFNKKGENDSCIIICGHYDSKNGPGVNDNGTGIYAIYQIAKLIKTLETKYTLKFLYFSGEEIDYLGSKDFVKNINNDSVKIKFVFNLDQLGGNIGLDNSGIKCERDELSGNKNKSHEIVQTMVSVYKAYTNLKAAITPAYQSDYLSFRDAGYVISGIYQYSESPFTHTENDLLKYVELNSLVEITKGALAFVIHASEAKILASSKPKIANNSILNVYYADNTLIIRSDLNCELAVFNYLGKKVLLKTGLKNDDIVSTENLPAGVYFAYLTTEKNTMCNKFIIQP